MSTISASYIYGTGLTDRQEIAVPSDAQQWFSANLNSRIPVGAGRLSVQSLFPLLIQIASECLVELVEKAGGKVEAIAIIQKTYMDYVAPLDIPIIPNFIEPSIDRAIAVAIGVLFSAVIDKLPEPTIPQPPVVPAAEPTP
jgi:hypothetical protein